MSESEGNIEIKGARENNLKGFDLSIPRGKLIVISGISGSGKSSLAFDTLYAEGHRRFAESLSSFARQFLGRMNKPDVDIITGIPPAIAVQQKVNTSNPRSTIATTTEIYEYLKLLFAKIGHTFSPISGKEVTRDSEKDVMERLLSHPTNTVVIIAARVDWGAMETVEMLLNLKENGFSRIVDIVSGEILKIDAVLGNLSGFSTENKMVLIDRAIVSNDEDFRSRVLDSLQTAFNQGNGHIAAGPAGEMALYSNIYEADGIVFEEPSENLFSFNSPLGACPECGGYGKIVGIDPGLVIPDPTLSIYEGAVACWRGELMKEYLFELVNNAWRFDFPIHKPYNELSKEQQKLVWTGNQYFTGINGFFDWVRKNKYKIQFNYMLARYSGKTTCPECGGSRLRKESLYVQICGKTIADVMEMSIKEADSFFGSLQLSDYDSVIAERPLTEIRQRLGYMLDVGLGYLTLNRASATLSCVESQRGNLVSSLGNNLTGSLYILDEPSIGLHSRDTARLIKVLKRLRDLGNTVIVVEHDREIIEAADQLIDVGPFAGVHGGEIVYQGTLPGADSGVDACNGKSLTLDYLCGKRVASLPRTPRKWSSYIEIIGAAQNNLKSINVQFPLRCLTAVTGVSGSGKSSLVGDILYPAIYRHINQMGDRPGIFRELKGNLDKISAVEYIDQNPIGKSTRSNPATYLKVYDEIRKLFSEQPYAKMNGYGHSHFSFNIDGGRCPECQGEGVIHIEMQFMADVTMVCESCGGKRFLPDILEVKYNNKNISDVLEMSVDDAIVFFSEGTDSTAHKIAEKLKPLQSVGLGYLQLGQSSSTLSGGESQRVKLASFLGRENTSGSILFIFDEPTTGLHFYDIEKLLAAFDALIAKGHSIILVEHNLDVIRAADWVIELGPEAGDKGGEMIFAGTPQELAKRKELPTGAYL